MARSGPVLLVGTRKGVFVVSGDDSLCEWTVSAPMFLGHIVQHAVLDPRNRRRLLLGVSTGHLGPTVFHSDDLGATWRVFPMDGTDVWPRTSPDGHPAVYRTRDAGASWVRCDKALPATAWFTVKRQAMTVDDAETVGVYFGTTSGEIWASADEGDAWRCIASHLPEIYSVEFADPDPSIR